MPRANVKIVEVLAVMAEFNPFLEKAGMIRVDYKKDETSVEKKMRGCLEAHGFDSASAGSKI